MTTTELIKILQDNETGAISLKPREISLAINGRYMPNPQITLSSTGDGICGAEIDLDVCGEWLVHEPCDDVISRQSVLKWIQQSLSKYGNTYTTDMLNMWGLFEKQIKTFTPVNPKSDVLDKISAEIEEIRTYDGIYIDRAYVLEIIDKYNADMLK